MTWPHVPEPPQSPPTLFHAAQGEIVQDEAEKARGDDLSKMYGKLWHQAVRDFELSQDSGQVETEA